MSDATPRIQTVAARLADVQERVARAAARSGRTPDSIALVGVAKRIAPPLVVDALRAGLQHVGENYLQEALERKASVEEALQDAPRSHAPRWHFIGQLQSNKARAVVEHFDLLHTLDRASLGRALERHAAEAGRRLDVLLQVNQSGEAHKGGLAPDAIEGFLAQCEAWPNLRVTGLMSIPAPSDDPETLRPVFAALRTLRDELAHPDLVELSMGMSGDFEVAIEEGATIVRVGTALFGPRPAGPAAQAQQEA